ncbi:hypothetical protein [Nakamurella sp.]|uniref:hypothetical protein n=1 Tax=Nakamurella sp. TaxID=1869182 RepID=UPI0037837B59
MKPLSLILGFIPWIAFSFLAHRIAADSVAWSGLIGLLLVLGTMALQKPAWPPSVLNIGMLIPLTTITVVGFVGGPDVDAWLYDWAVPGVGLFLGAFILALVPFAPFTERFARESTPKAYWGSPTFNKINRVLSAAWGAAIVIMGLCSLLVAALNLYSDDFATPATGELLLNWVVPIVVIVAMIKFTVHYPEKVRSQVRAPQAPAAPSTT